MFVSICLCVFADVEIRIVVPTALTSVPSLLTTLAEFALVIFYIQINVSLAVFNMLPIPPLDGSKLLLYFLGEKNRQKFYAIEPYCMIAVVGLMYFAPGFFSSIIGGISNVILSLLARII